jgi:hypothetical protein
MTLVMQLPRAGLPYSLIARKTAAPLKSPQVRGPGNGWVSYKTVIAGRTPMRLLALGHLRGRVRGVRKPV